MIDKPDNDDFKAATRDVKRLKPSDRAARQTPKPKPKAGLGKRGGAAGSSAADRGEDALTIRRPGLSETDFRRLRRGRFVIEDEIDLHGLSGREAERYLRHFIGEASKRGLGCVLVVHGKGRRSGSSGPVLKTLAWQLLSQSEQVLAAVPAQEKDGGGGAVYVLLRGR